MTQKNRNERDPNVPPYKEPEMPPEVPKASAIIKEWDEGGFEKTSLYWRIQQIASEED